MGTGNSKESERGGASGAAALKLVGVFWVVVLTWWLAIPLEPGFSFDDREAIQGNPVVEGTVPASEAFRRDYWHHYQDAGHYRPMATLLLRFDHPGPSTDEDPEPRRYRRTNVALHGLVVLLLGLAFLRLDAVGIIAFPWFGLALFGLHPAAADVVAWISGRTSLVSGLGAAAMILGLSWFAGPREGLRKSAAPWLSVTAIGAAAFLGSLLALMGKEDGVVVAAAAVPFTWAVARGGRWPWAKLAAAAVGAILAVVLTVWLRHMALGEALPSSPAAPLRSAPMVQRLALGIAAWSQGILHGLTPWIAAPPSLEISDLVPGEGDPGWLGALLFGRGVSGAGLAGIVGFLGAGLMLLRGQSLARWSLFGMCAAAVPLIQVVPAGELFAPRFLYQPLLLGIPALSGIAQRFTRGINGKAVSALLALILLGLSGLSIHRAAPVFASRTSYWQAHLPAHEREAKVWNALGECARETGERPEAERLFRKAHLIDPRYSRPISSLGAMALRAGRFKEAREWLELAILEGPNSAAPRGNLASLCLREGQADEAEDLYRDALRISPGRATFHRGLSRALLAQGRVAESGAALEEAEALDPSSQLNRSLRLQLNRARPQRPASDGSSR